MFSTEDPSFIIPAGTEVFEDIAGLTSQVLGFEDPEVLGAMNFGSTVRGRDVTVAMSANKVLPRHCLIVGSTGTGKSYLAVSSYYALDLRGMQFVMAYFMHQLVAEEGKLIPKGLTSHHKRRRNMPVITGATFAVSVLPQFGVWLILGESRGRS